MSEKKNAYLKDYYQKVLKPKRQAEAQKRKLEKQNQPLVLRTVSHECPMCGRTWEEEITSKYSRRKQFCPDCKKKRDEEKRNSVEFKEQRKEYVRNRYATNEEFRQKRLADSRKYYEKVMSDETLKEKRNKNARKYWKKYKKENIEKLRQYWANARAKKKQQSTVDNDQ